MLRPIITPIALISVFIINNFLSYAQDFTASYNIKSDSLIQLIQKTEEDTDKALLLCKLGWLYKDNDPEKALLYTKDALDLSQKISFEKGIAQAYTYIGVVYYNIGEYSVAMENQLKALEIAERIGEKRIIRSNYDYIASIFRSQGFPDRALEYQFKCLEVANELGEKNVIAGTYNNIALIQQETGMLDSALKNYLLAIKINEETRDKNGVARIYNNMAFIYFDRKQWNDAKDLLSKGIQLCKEIDDKTLEAALQINLGTAFAQLHEYPIAYTYLNQGLKMAKEIGSKDLITNAYGTLSDTYEQQGDIANAFKNYKLFTTGKDSLLNEQNSRSIIDMQTKYETTKKEKENQIQKLQLSSKNIQLYSIMLLLVLGGCIAFLLFRQYKLQVLQKELIHEQKVLRLQMNPHFQFNAISAILDGMNHRSIEATTGYLKNFSELMRLVLESSRTDYIPLEKELIIINNYLRLQKLRLSDKFDYTVNVAPEIEQELISIPPMMIQPFIENAIEHGINKVEYPGKVNIKFYYNKDVLVIEIEDNGIGINNVAEQKREHKSLSSIITTERIVNLNKNRRNKILISIADRSVTENTSGTKVTFRIPPK